MIPRTFRRKHHPLVWIALLLPVVLGLDALAQVVYLALHLLPWLLLGAVVVLACRRWQLHRRIAGWPPGAPRPVVQGQVISEAEDLRRQVAKLEADAAVNEQLIEDFEAAAGRSIQAATSSYRRLQEVYGPVAVGKSRRRP